MVRDKNLDVEKSSLGETNLINNLAELNDMIEKP